MTVQQPTDESAPPAPAAPRVAAGDEPILPQRPSEAKAGINSPHWSFEPYWLGDRLLARIQDGTVRVTDDRGEVMDDFYRDLAEVLRAGVDAESAVLDGVWTVQPFLGPGSAAQRWSEAIALETGEPPEEAPDPAELESRRAFVVVDLVELDGQFLGALPYQERRRLLVGLIAEGIRLRVTPSVKVPLGSWFQAWQENGFDRAVAKHVNSRYQPGTTSPDWIVVSIGPEKAPGVSRLFWKERRKKDITR